MSVHHRGIPDSEDDLCARQYRAQVLAERGRSCTFCHEWTGLGLAAQKAEKIVDPVGRQDYQVGLQLPL